MNIRHLLTLPPTHPAVPRWQQSARWGSWRVPQQWRPWLTDRGSLTQHLISASHNEFSVKLLSVRWAYPAYSEALALGLPVRKKALIREVMLRGKLQDWVFARSVIPATTLTGCERQLHLVGQRSLGSVLFSDPTMQREPLQIAALTDQESTLWARRSVFRLSGKPLLVAEVFLPALEQVHYSPSRY